MTTGNRHPVLGVLVSAVDQAEAVRRVTHAAQTRVPFAVTALAVHGVMTGVQDPAQRARLNAFDLVLPDGQPVRWALNLLHGARLTERVYGPDLMLTICRAAGEQGLGIYLYGSTPEVLEKLVSNLQERFPALRICGAEPSKFRPLSPDEKAATIDRIRASGASITFVGLGCPRQEVWTYEYHDALGMPVIAVGAAFDFHAGTTPRAPAWMQKRGLEWLFRLRTDPRRLWKRYLLLNPQYLTLVALQALGIYHVRTEVTGTRVPELSYG